MRKLSALLAVLLFMAMATALPTWAAPPVAGEADPLSEIQESALPQEDIAPEVDGASDEQQPDDAEPAEEAPDTDAGERLVYVQEFASDHYLKGLFAQGHEYFQIGNWALHSVTLRLEYAVTPLVRAEVAEVTLYLNGEPFHSFPLEKGGDGRQVLEVALPLEAALIDSGNLLAMETYVRSGADECIDDVTGSNWINIYKESSLTVQYTPLNKSDTIAGFYRCFTALEALDNGWSGIYLNPAPSAQELSVAANVAGGVTANAVLFYEEIAVGFASSAQQMARYAVYVSEYASLSDEIRSALSAGQQKAAQRGAVIALVALEDRHVLVLTGSDGEALLQTGTLLANKLLMPQLNGDTKEVSASEDYFSPAWQVEQYLPLTETGTQVKGTFRQNASFYIDYPANRKITANSEISLDFRYSENLDFERSLVTVFVNDEPVGSKKLEKENASGDSLVLNFPEDVEVTGTFTVRVAFDLDMGDEWCRLAPEEMPWGYVAETSMLKIASVDLPYLDFSNYPSPFLRDGSLNETLILLPNGPTVQDLEAMHGIALTLGRFLKDNHGSLRVAFYEDGASLADKNVIAIGQSGQNAVLAEQREAFPFRFSDNGELLLSNEKMSVESGYGKSLGVGQMILSPYSEQVNALLVVSGTTPEAMLRAARMLGTEQGIWQLSGDAYVADAKENATCFLFETDRQAYEMPVEKGEESISGVTALVVVAAAVLVLLALALVLVIRKYRRRYDENEPK